MNTEHASPKLIFISGFLGAGKTTLVWESALGAL
jgi:tRNA A37 threonylcarbamoyladenosine biosynthesis protein TsaE